MPAFPRPVHGSPCHLTDLVLKKGDGRAEGTGYSYIVRCACNWYMRTGGADPEEAKFLALYAFARHISPTVKM